MNTNLENNPLKKGDMKEMAPSSDQIYDDWDDKNKSRENTKETSQTQTTPKGMGYDDDPFTISCEIDVDSMWNID